MTAAERAAATHRYDTLRAPFLGILEAGWGTFALVIAIRHFEAPEIDKAFIAGAWPMGFLLTPLTLYLLARLRCLPSLACGLLFALSGLLMIGASAAQSLALYTGLIIGSQIASGQHGPLALQIYTDNYAPNERGRRLSTPLALTALSAILFSLLGGWLLDASIHYYPILFSLMSCAALLAAWLSYQIPSRALAAEHVGHPWQNISLLWKDRFFGYLLHTWMLLGLGNLITLPIRVEYLANPKYGINADNTTIAFLLLVVPSAARVVSTKMWGRVFDTLPLITTRNLLNLCFLLSIGGFFFSRNLVLLTLSMLLLGLATSGGKIIWSLWVTKIAPPAKAASYMSIHMALTGIRGSLAPFIGYWILSQSNCAPAVIPRSVAIVGMLLVALAMFLFERVRGHQRLRGPVDASESQTIS